MEILTEDRMIMEFGFLLTFFFLFLPFGFRLRRYSGVFALEKLFQVLDSWAFLLDLGRFPTVNAVNWRESR